jgi:hypothetical protein
MKERLFKVMLDSLQPQTLAYLARDLNKPGRLAVLPGCASGRSGKLSELLNDWLWVRGI